MSRKKLRAAGVARGTMSKSIVRTASKSMEKNIVKRAKQLYDNPFLVLPSYSDNDSKKAFKKTETALKKIEKVKDDQKKLEKFASKKTLPAAVAGTLLIAHTEKTPYLAAANLTTGTVNYAQRGNASKENLISAQYTDDPFLRLLAIREIALSKDLHIYSWDAGFISTGKTPDPPDAFVDFVLKQLSYNKRNRVVTCNHLTKEIITNKEYYEQPYLYIHWKSADAYIGICQDCISKNQNTFFLLTKYLIAPNVSADFKVAVIGKIIKQNEKTTEETEFLDDYFSGKLTDKALIKKNMDLKKDSLRQQDKTMYVLDGKTYENKEDFVTALHPNEYEKQALLYIIDQETQPVIVEDVTPNAVLELYWESFGLDFLKTIIENTTIAEELHKLHDTPSNIIKTAFDYQKKQGILKSLPTYKSLPEIAAFLDSMARTYRISGKEKMLSSLKGYPETPKGKAIAYALYVFLGKATDVKWKFSKVEIESGEFALPYVKTLLECEPNSYHESLKTILKMIGASEEIDHLKKM